MRRFIARAALAACAAMACIPALAADAGTLVHLLDYIAVDYPEAVAAGQVRNAGEYREMTDFAASVREGIAKLPEHPRKATLAKSAQALAGLVAAKAPAADISAAAGGLRRDLIAAYDVSVGPRRAPGIGRATALFAEHCAGCHGAAGAGDGPLAKGMDPAPSDFTDPGRQGKRSIHGLYNTITLGVEGTAMRAFPELAPEDRWALAYLAAGWGTPGEAVERGRTAWEAGRHRELFRSQADIAGRTAEETQGAHGPEAADVLAFLRHEPSRLDAARPDPLDHARARLRESVSLHAAGRVDEAVQASLSAYLEGFELAEAALSMVDADSVRRIEGAMIEYRNALKSGVSTARIAEMAAALDGDLARASEKVGGTALAPFAAGLASFLILLREGLEAVLVVTALLAFARRSGQAAAARFLHAGWAGALVLGFATWAAATWLVEISGAGRELTEGITALVASAMLLYVGFWLHDKSHAGAWQSFILRGAESRRGAAWGLAVMAFLAVYREVFETVLFYQALWLQAPGARAAIAGGFAAAAVVLAAITWALLRYSLRLPLGLFFGASGMLLAALAVVLAGNGVAALQEAGALPASPVEFVTISWLGIHPTLQALSTQLAVAVIVIALFALSRRRAARPLAGRPQA